MDTPKTHSPLDFARAVFDDERNPAGLRLRAAIEIIPYLQALIAPDGRHVSDERRRTSDDAKAMMAKAKAFIEHHERPRS